MIAHVEQQVALKTVLVVEDEGLIAMDLQRRLESLGYIVPACATTADDAVRLAALHIPDLILMDIHLKGEKDGIDAAGEIRKKCDVPIIFVTAHTDPNTLSRAKTTEPLGYIVKPFTSTDIRIQIEIALHKYQVDHRLRRSEGSYSSTFRNMGEAVMTTGVDGTVEFMNATAERLTGWSQQQASGGHFGKILPLEQAGMTMTGDLIRLATLSEGPLSVGPDLVLVSRDGQRHEVEVEISSAAPVAGQIAIVVFTFRDIMQRKWDDNQQSEKQAIRSVERLAKITTRALNNLLTSILGHGELLLHASGLSAEHLDIASEIYTGALKLSEVVGHLSAISRTEVVTVRDININEIIQQFIEVVPNSLPGVIVVKTELHPEVHKISANSDQLRQVLFALLSNAQDAIPGVGKIVISTQNSVMDAPGRLKESRRMVTVKVRDTGEGMDRETRERIFEPFFTTKRDTGAHPGLGLCLAQGIIRDYNGFVDVKSGPGLGTEVTFGLPAIEEDPFAYMDGSADSVQAGKTILVALDDHGVRKLLRKILEKNEYVVVEALDGENALTVATLHPGRIDVLLTDIAMPGISYTSLVRQFAALHPEARALLLSGFPSDPIEPAPDLPRGVDFLQTPFRQEDLLMRVQRLLSGAAATNSRIEEKPQNEI